YDPDLAMAWLERIERTLANEDEVAQLNGASPAVQRARVNDVLHALAYAYQAANFPPTSDAVAFVPVMHAAYGPGIDYAGGIAVAHPRQGWVTQQALDAMSAVTHRSIADISITFPLRVYLTPRARVLIRCFELVQCIDPDTGRTFAWAGHAGVGAT